MKRNQVKRKEGVSLEENKTLLNGMSVDEVFFLIMYFFIIIRTIIGYSAFDKDGIGNV